MRPEDRIQEPVMAMRTKEEARACISETGTGREAEGGCRDHH